MKRTMAIMLWALMLCPASLWADTFYFHGNGIASKDIEEALKENPLRPDEDIRSTLLHKTDGASVHLIQIRGKEKPHIHKTHDLIVILKNGSGRLNLGGKSIDMKEGDSAFIPRGLPHYFENTSKETAAGVGIFVPAYDGKDNVPATP